MTRLILALPLALAALAPADTARAGGAGPVAEIVTFHLAPDTSEAAFLDAARATEPLLAAEPGFLSRRLSRGADGRWTDHVTWASSQRPKQRPPASWPTPSLSPSSWPSTPPPSTCATSPS
jgi:hypothetical protein